MRLDGHLTAIRDWCNKCLPGRRKPDVLRAGIMGMRGHMVLQTAANLDCHCPPAAVAL